MKKSLYVLCFLAAAAFGFGGLANADDDSSPDTALEQTKESYDRKNFRMCVLSGESWDECGRELSADDPLRTTYGNYGKNENEDSDIWENIFWPPRGGLWLNV